MSVASPQGDPTSDAGTAHDKPARETPVSHTVPCAHCGLPTRVDDPTAWMLHGDRSRETSGDSLMFCCHGCMGAYALIHELGLDDFYSLRGWTNAEVAPVRSVRRHDVLKDLEAAGVPVETFADGLCRVRLSVDGLHCAACSWLIEKMQPTIPGLKSARVRMSDSTLDMIYDPHVTNPAIVADRLARLGYGLQPRDDSEESSAADRALRRDHWIGMATAFFLAANAMWVGISLYAGESTGMTAAHANFLRWVGAVLGLLAAVGPGQIFYRSAWESMRAGVPHVDIPVALGLTVGTLGSVVGAAMGHGHVYFDSLASLVFLLRVGRYIQFRAQYRTGLSISRLLRMNQGTAVRIGPDGQPVTVPAYRLREGDVVEVLPGQTVPADGIVIEGNSAIQTAFITGESRPVAIAVGSDVVGGSANLNSPIRMRVTAAGDASRMGRLNEMVRSATEQRTPLIQLADRIGGVFVIAVLALSVLTFGVWWYVQGPADATEHTVALLTIACPCALALAAPLVITVALGRAAKEQIWIRDGNALERLARPGVLWFDKTGTLTYGDLQVLDWHGSQEVLLRAAALESQSDHPAARAIQAFVQQQNPQWHPSRHRIEKVEQRYGVGIFGVIDGVPMLIGLPDADASSEFDTNLDEATGRKEAPRSRTVCQRVTVSIDGRSVGGFVLGDRERPGAIEALQSLSRRGWSIGLLSGDRDDVVATLSAHLKQSGIPLIASFAGQSPEQKLQHVLQHRSEYPTSVMVGDGINDAAALAAADVGIAIRGSGETCLRNAPVYIPNNQLESIVRLVDASKNTVRGIYRCFAASLLYNAITISLAATGWIHPLIAALFMPLSGITVLTMALLARTFAKEGRRS